jgi:hypothetical protein
MHTFDTIVVSSAQALIELAEVGKLDKLLTTARRILITDVARYGLSENFTMTVHAVCEWIIKNELNQVFVVSTDEFENFLIVLHAYQKKHEEFNIRDAHNTRAASQAYCQHCKSDDLQYAILFENKGTHGIVMMSQPLNMSWIETSEVINQKFANLQS